MLSRCHVIICSFSAITNGTALVLTFHDTGKDMRKFITHFSINCNNKGTQCGQRKKKISPSGPYSWTQCCISSCRLIHHTPTIETSSTPQTAARPRPLESVLMCVCASVHLHVCVWVCVYIHKASTLFSVYNRPRIVTIASYLRSVTHSTLQQVVLTKTPHHLFDTIIVWC